MKNINNIKSFFQNELNTNSDESAKGSRREIYLTEAVIFSGIITMITLILKELKIEFFSYLNESINVILEFIVCFVLFYILERVLTEIKIKRME